MTQEQRIEYFMSEIARLSNQVVDLQNERDALVAQVEALQSRISAAERVETIFSEAPELSFEECKKLFPEEIRELRAEDGRAGFVAGYEFCLSTLPSPYCNLIAVNYKGMAERYADTIRQEVK